jgi:hypothetical protein
MAEMKDHTHDHAHDDADELLDRYRTGELGEPDRLRVERHLETCEACRAELEALAVFTRVIERGYAAERAARAAEREPDWARLRAAVIARTSGRRSRAQRSRLARYIPQAALAVLALVALGVLWEQGVRGPGEAEQALRSEHRTGSRADGAGEDSGGPAVTPGADRMERAAREDRFAARAGAPETREPMEEALPESPDEANERRRDAALEDARFRVDVDGVEREADRAAEGAPADEAVAEAVAPVGQAQDQAGAEARPDPARPAAQAREEHAKAAAAPPPVLERFQRSARNALSEADTLLAARALAQWRDSLAPRRDLPPDLERAARALADSLAAFLATRP